MIMNAGSNNVQVHAWQGQWTPLKWSTHHGSFVVSTQKKPPIFLVAQFLSSCILWV